MSPFFSELKRRHVYRVAVAYAAVGWLLIQIVTQTFPVFSLPAWTQQLVILLVALGFPIALMLAWAHEPRPDGIRADATAGPPGEREQEAAPVRARRSMRAVALIAFLAMAATAAFAVREYRERAIASAPSGATADKTHPSIAVLPFENLSDDRGNAYFAEGMQDEILAQLSRLAGLRVMSRSSTARYKSHPEDATAVGRELGVSTILEGSVQKAGDRARITLQLIDAADDSHLWANTYDRDLSNVFTVESDVAAEVAGALKLTLLPKDRQRLAEPATRDPQAYDAFLRGEAAQQRALVTWLAVNIDAAIDAFGAATARDPQYALAFAHLAYAYAWKLHWVVGSDKAGLLRDCKSALDRALGLQPDLPEALVAAGYYELWGKEDNAAALEQFEHAARINPQDALANLAIGKIFYSQGHMSDAGASFERVLSVDPNDVIALQGLGDVQIEQREYADADKTLIKALAVDPHAGLTWGKRNYAAYFAHGDGNAMLAMVHAAPPDVQANPNHLYDRTYASYRAGDYAQARAALASVAGSIYPDVFIAVRRADIDWAAGDRAAASDEYRRAIEAIKKESGFDDRAQSDELLGWAEARLGDEADAERYGQRAVDLAPPEKQWDLSGETRVVLAAIYAEFARADKSAQILDRLLSENQGWNVSVGAIEHEIEWNPVREAPAFRAMLARHAPR